MAYAQSNLLRRALDKLQLYSQYMLFAFGRINEVRKAVDETRQMVQSTILISIVL